MKKLVGLFKTVVLGVSLCMATLIGISVHIQALGVTYNGLHATVNPDVDSVNSDLNSISNYILPNGNNFTAMRTYYPQFNGGAVSVMTQVAATAPQLDVLLGLYLFECHGQPSDWTANNLVNYVLPYLTSANLSGVLVGNEEGAASVGVVSTYINNIRQQPGGSNVAISSAQTANYWLTDSTAANLANICDFIAVNIYPSWDWGNPDTNNQPAINKVSLTPQQGFNSFVATYQLLVKKYPGKQIIVTETGWPTTYGWVVNAPTPVQYQIGINNASTYFTLVTNWASTNKVTVFCYSMFDDYYGVDTSSQYNFHFGLLDTNRNLKQGI